MKRRQRTEERGRVISAGTETSLTASTGSLTVAKKAKYLTTQEGEVVEAKNNKMVNRPAIISETPIDTDKLEAMEKVVNDGDFREMFGIKDDIPIEVQWTDDGKWTPAIVDKAETGKKHRFHDRDLESDESEPEYENDDEIDHDFCDVPVVTIIKDGEAPRRRGVCFINRCLLYDIDEGEIFNWKHFDDPWVGDVKGAQSSDIEAFDFTTEEELKSQIESFVPRMMCNVLEKNRRFFDQLPPDVQATMTAEVLNIKNSMIDKIVNYFIEKEALTPGMQVIMDPESMQKLCDQVLKEIYEKAQ